MTQDTQRRTDPVAKYNKDLAILRSWLIGKEFYVALDAMEFARGFHRGLRKDGVSPEFSHQVAMANFARTLLPSLLHPEETLATIMVHDVPEDYGDQVGFDDITGRFGARVGHSTMLMTKKHRGVTVPNEIYFPRMAQDAIAAPAKGVDNGFNIYTMPEAGWTVDKQEAYLVRGEQWVLPMLKESRRLFPQQVDACENIKSFVSVQIQHIRLSVELQRRLDAERVQEPDEGAAPRF